MKYAKLIPWFLIFPLIIALCVVTCQKQKIKYEVKTVDSTNYFKGKLNESLARGEVQRKDWQNDSLKMSERVERLNKTVSVVTKQRDEARKLVQEKINADPELKQFVHLDDSVDRLNLALIDTLTQDKREIIKSFSGMISTLEEQKQIMRETIDHLTALNKGLSKDLRRERRIKTVWKIVSGVLVAVVIYEAVQD